VIDLIVGGATNKEMAQNTYICIYNKSHAHNIFEKFTLHSRIQIAKHSYLSE
jgi:DNA-binding NarL/FixJ family response regulator